MGDGDQRSGKFLDGGRLPRAACCGADLHPVGMDAVIHSTGFLPAPRVQVDDRTVHLAAMATLAFPSFSQFERVMSS
jgi:hypothetical protein